MSPKGNRPGAGAAKFVGSSTTVADTSPTTTSTQAEPLLALYDRACTALAAAKSVDEVKHILDTAVAMRAYAKQAKNREAEADAVEIRMRATRRLDEMRQAQAATVGLNTGAAAGGQKTGPRGLLVNPRDSRPTLASQGIDKNLAHQARVLGAQSDEAFEKTIIDARAAVNRAIRTVVQAAELDQERERAETCVAIGGAAGGTAGDLIELAASGYRAGAILADPPWQFVTWSHRGLAGDSMQENRGQRGRVTPYKTMPLEEICALPVGALAAQDCVLFLWVVRSHLPVALEVIRAWGFEFKSVAFTWFKGDDQDNVADVKVPIGTGIWTRTGSEQCWLVTRGNPRRLHADVREVIVEPRREHSRKPDCVHDRVQRLVAGPYLELFARRERAGWLTWGDEISPPAPAAAAVPACAAISTTE